MASLHLNIGTGVYWAILDTLVTVTGYCFVFVVTKKPKADSQKGQNCSNCSRYISFASVYLTFMAVAWMIEVSSTNSWVSVL